jgi:hypothetical protein
VEDFIKLLAGVIDMLNKLPLWRFISILVVVVMVALIFGLPDILELLVS